MSKDLVRQDVPHLVVLLGLGVGLGGLGGWLFSSTEAGGAPEEVSRRRAEPTGDRPEHGASPNVAAASGSSTRSERPPHVGLHGTGDAETPEVQRSRPRHCFSPAQVTFRRGSARLSEADVRTLSPAAKWLRNHPERSIVVDGHCDATAGDLRNLRLSRRRAQAVVRALRKMGVANPMVARGLGAFAPDPRSKPFEAAQRRAVVLARPACAPDAG